MSKDQVWSQKFWDSQIDEGYSRRAMAHHILSGNGIVAFFVADPLSDDDKARMSACRVLANEMGYIVGQFRRKQDRMIAFCIADGQG